MNRTPQQTVTDPWRDKGERLWLIGALALLPCVVFASYDGKGFHARYLHLCTERPTNRECRPLNMVKQELPPDLGIRLDYGQGKWALEVGPREDEARANELAARLRSYGVDPRVIKSSGRGKKTWYQVQVGRFPSRKAVTEAGTQLKGRGVVQDFRVGEYRAIR